MTEIEIANPYNGERIDALPLDNEEACLAALERAHTAYANRKLWLPKRERIRILKRTAELVHARSEELARQAASEGGKPLVDSRVEVQRGVAGIEAAIHSLVSLNGSEVPMDLNEPSADRVAYTWREPRGVVLAISAFNHPFNLIVHQVVTAVAAGCPVIVKPAAATPLSCRSLVRILHEAGLPQVWCQMLLCENDVAEKLVSSSRVAFLTFIGSARVGWHLRSKLAPGATCALEHGGIAPVVVDETANLDDAIPRLVKGGYYHAGQVCVSVQRIYVHESIANAFIDRFSSAVKSLRVGDPLSEETEVGPLIRPAEVERVHEWVRQAVRAGATLVAGGEPFSKTCYAPTVLVDPPDDARVTTEEIFGPVVSIYRYRDLDEAITRANTPESYYFQAALFTNRLETTLRARQRLNAMALMINDHTAFRVDWMPFGGHRSSGLGVGGIGYTMHEMTIERMLVVRSQEL